MHGQKSPIGLKLKLNLTSFATFLLLATLRADVAPAPPQVLVTIHPEKPGVKIPADFLGFSYEKSTLFARCNPHGHRLQAAGFRRSTLRANESGERLQTGACRGIAPIGRDEKLRGMSSGCENHGADWVTEEVFHGMRWN
jgi:hypothetical protein